MRGRFAFVCIGLISPFAGHAAATVAPPAMYPANLWQGRQQAVIRVLDRVDSHLETLTVPVDGEGVYKTLHIALHRCVDRPPTLRSDAAVLATMTDSSDAAMHFDGWMLAQEPSLSALPSSLYRVSVVSCAGGTTAPEVPPLSQVSAPQRVADTPDASQNQPGDAGDGALPGQPSETPSGGPLPLGPAEESGQSAPQAAQPVRPQSAPHVPAAPPPADKGEGPMQLAPPEDDTPAPPPPSRSGPQSLPPPQPYPG